MENFDNEKAWDEIAPLWGKFRTRISPSVEDFLKDKSGKLLDVGCGSGRNFVNMTGINWYATDISQKMLDQAKNTAKEKGMKVELEKAQSHKLPYDGNFFGSVICFAVLHCIETPEKRKRTLEEIYRVLKTGGEALISSWGRKSPRLRTKEKECFVPWTTREDDRTERYTYIFDLEELKNLAEEAGFQIVRAWEERNVNLIVKKV